MTSHVIQLELINCCAKETTSLIMKDLGEEYFAILADESSDVYPREELALCLRYVDKVGWMVERFLGIVHVEDTTSLTLKKAIEKLLMDNSLSFSMVRGHGYDGASNMKGKANGLKKLIMDESPSAYYVHCFAHQLQLTLVAVAKENGDCFSFFQQLSSLLNVLGLSCKKIQMFREAQVDYLIEALQLDELETGKGQNQEMGLGRPCETRWGSHSKTVSHVLSLYPSIKKVLKRIGKEYNSVEGIGAQTILRSFESFEFVFMLHLMEELFGYTDGLSQALQRRDQDIVNAIDLISLTKQQLLNLREDSGWALFLENVKSFCLKHKIKFFKKVKDLHLFRIDMFLGLIDRQLQELNNRFDEVNTELLVCMASFNPVDSFAAYDQEKLVKLAHFYPKDFSKTEILKLPYELSMFIADMRRDERFIKMKNIAQLSAKLVETKKNISYAIVYKLLKLVLILPVATASVERVFSSMNYVKNKLRAKMGEQYLNDCLVTFLKRKFFIQVKEGTIISRFQNGDRRVKF
ncbi:hypothetical protein ZWY2020_000707 [Hordeum vulgare]|nr:hypothetical protein ZWY2020_000707 [Hordeum vulgare]